MNDFKRIDEARKILGLGETASLEDIKKAYREKCLKYHPDRCKDARKKECEKMMKNINDARNIVLDYCINYKFSFAKQEIKKNTKEKELNDHLERFYNGWWGDLDL
ncbi:MAG TPA: molecular chaperone DnaJ [Elusimicrobia bacterium]|nr:molecular chaperone DnaJ [Elusimicrobiota bacterium]